MQQMFSMLCWLLGARLLKLTSYYQRFCCQDAKAEISEAEENLETQFECHRSPCRDDTATFSGSCAIGLGECPFPQALMQLMKKLAGRESRTKNQKSDMWAGTDPGRSLWLQEQPSGPLLSTARPLPRLLGSAGSQPLSSHSCSVLGKDN